jgi:hypothetical protein
MGAGPLHATLQAGVVATLELDQIEPRPDNLSFVNRIPRVEVLNVDGSAAVYFTTDGAVPVVRGDGCHVLPAAITALEVDDATPGPTTVVKLISDGTPHVSIRAT